LVLPLTSEGPGARYAASASYDGFRDRLILFGGRAIDSQARTNDTWALPLAGGLAWQPIRPAGALPHVRSGATAVWGPGADRIILFGGEWWTPPGPTESVQRLLSDTWFLNMEGEARWDSVETERPSEFASTEHFADFDAARGTMEVIGFSRQVDDPLQLNRTALRSLELQDPPGWHIPAVGGAPFPGGTSAPAFDSMRDRLFAFRGLNLEDAWVLDGGLPTLLAPLDFEPNDPANTIPAHGAVTVAVLGTPAFDAASVDPASASLAGAPARADNRSDRAALRDVNGDGLLDRLLKFDADQLHLPPQTRVIRLDARTRAGVAVVAYDLVQGISPHRTPVALAGDPDSPTDQILPLELSCRSPVHGTAHFRLDLPHPGRVVIEVFAVSGRRLVHQELGLLEAGSHELPADSGGYLPAGVYLARASLGSESVRRKFVVLP
jgi:hypothetical protein